MGYYCVGFVEPQTKDLVEKTVYLIDQNGQTGPNLGKYYRIV